jgi:MscS family membrane protein
MTQLDAFLLYLAENPLVRDCLSFVFLVLFGAMMAWGANRVARLFLTRWLRGVERPVAERIIKATEIPLGLLFFSYFVIWGLDQFQGMPAGLGRRIHSLYPIISGLALLMLGFRLIDIAAQLLRVRWGESEDDSGLDERWALLIGWIGKSVIALIGILMILGNLGINVVPLLTGAGFVGAAFALASQSTIANAIGSFEVMVDKLFKEGDRISFGEYDGFVTKMGLRSIELTALTGEKINLPNKDVVDKQIRNYTRHKLVRTLLSVGLAYRHSRAELEKAMQILLEIAGNHPRIKKQEAVFRKFNDSTLDLEVIFWADYKTSPEYNQLMTDLHLAIKERFDAEKLEFAFPSRTIYLAPGTERVPVTS